MATITKVPGKKQIKRVENSNNFSFQNYVLNILAQIQNEIRELKTDIREIRSNMISLQRWVTNVAIGLFLGLLTLKTFFYNKLDNKIEKNTQAIHNVERKLDRMEIEIKSELKEILKRLPEH